MKSVKRSSVMVPSCWGFTLIELLVVNTDENRDIFPAHRNQNERDNPTTALTNRWGTAVIGYARTQSNLFHCPAIKGQQLENGVPWVWAFDCHKVGYGINSYFDCFWPYLVGSVTVGGIRFDTGPWFKRTNVKSPADTFLIGDGMPKADGYWSSSCWWPNGCMNQKTSARLEVLGPFEAGGRSVSSSLFIQ